MSMEQAIKNIRRIIGIFVSSRYAKSGNAPRIVSAPSTEEVTQQPDTDYLTNEYFELCKLEAITLPLDTSTKFNAQREDHELSPIDLFITNTTELNKLIGSNYSPMLGNLLLLGYVSAAESYIRTLIRRLINCDEYISTLVSEKTVSFAAALHHKKDILPEALLEEFSLASPYNVFETLKDLIGMKGHRPASLIPPSEEFKKVCELRHCCVHRFGKLGSKNAIRLGMSEHIEHLEKPILLNQSDIESIAFIVENFVRSINNYVYKFILERSAKNKNDADNGRPFYETEWTWDFTTDKERFNNYYTIFATTADLVKSMTVELSYKKFLDEFKPKPQSLPKRKKKPEADEIDQTSKATS